MNLITKKAFAELAGCSQSTISSETKPGRALAAAMQGVKIDADHANSQHFLHGSKKRPRHTANIPGVTNPLVNGGLLPPPPPPPEADTPGRSIGVDESRIPLDLSDFYDMKLKDIIDIYGTMPEMLDWLKAGKLLEDIKAKQIRNAKEEGELIPRTMVEKSIMGYIVEANTRLLNDTPSVIALNAKAMFESGSALSEVKNEIQRNISTQVKSVKRKVLEALDEL